MYLPLGFIKKAMNDEMLKIKLCFDSITQLLCVSELDLLYVAKTFQGEDRIE